MLIIFEGCEGSGKGTQINLLNKYLTNKGFKVLNIVEPGGTDVGQAIREILLNRNDLKIDGLTEALLFSASRSYQTENITKPALNNGYIVLSDRSYYSTYAYQGYARGNSLDVLKNLTSIAVNNLKPDIVIYLDIDPKIGLSRKSIQNEVNRLDKENLEFHQKVRKGYLKLLKSEPDIWVSVDSSNSAEFVHSEIIKILFDKFKI